MRRARVGQLVLALVTVLFILLLGAHLLVTHGANAVETRASGTGSMGHGPASCHKESDSDDAVGERRPRSRPNVADQLEPPKCPPTAGGVTPFAGAAAFDSCRDGYRSASRYGAAVPPHDTSPESLQVWRC